MKAEILRRFTPQNDSLCCTVILSILFCLMTSTSFAQDFQRALPGRAFSFPRDHFSHPEFKTEWWYYSGHLQSGNRDKRSFGYQLTFFRTGLKRETKQQGSKWSIQSLYFAHLALTDESRKKFDYREKIHRGSLGEAGAAPYGANEKTFRIWLEDWSVEGRGAGLRDHSLRAGDKDLGIELTLTPEKNPVVHGEDGISRKAEGEGYASHYYSIPRLKTEGKIFQKDSEIPVRGLSWMDHEFGSSQLRDDQVGWDWFSIQLENRVELMFYQIRQETGRSILLRAGPLSFPMGLIVTFLQRSFRLKSWIDGRVRKAAPLTLPGGRSGSPIRESN